MSAAFSVEVVAKVKPSPGGAAVSFGAMEETLGQALMEEEPIGEAEAESEDEEETR